VNDLRERFVKEARLREAAIAQVEQALLNQQNAKAGTPVRDLVAQPLIGQMSAGESAERWRQAEEEMERTRRAVVLLQSETTTLNKSVNGLNDGFDLFKTKLGNTADELAEVQKRLKTFVEMEGQVVAARDEMRKETAERKAECERLAIMIGEGAERLERTEQARIKAEGQMRQEVLDTRTALKKEARDRELMASTFTLAVREEAQKREEMVEREAKLRQEAQERAVEAFHAALREERRTREKEDLRIEGRSLGTVGAKAPTDASSSEAVGLVMEQRALRQSLTEMADRLGAAEVRQRNAEERTVSMLDAIMGGLTGVPE